MNHEESAQILGISPKASRRRADDAYGALLRGLTGRLQYDPDPDQRDVAARSIHLLKQAYAVFTGTPPPRQVHGNVRVKVAPPRRVSLKTSPAPPHAPAPKTIPRRSIAGKPKTPVAAPKPPRVSSAPLRTSAKNTVTEQRWAWGIVLGLVVMAVGLVSLAIR